MSKVHTLTVSLPPSPLFALTIGINEYESCHIPNLVGTVPHANAMRYHLHEHQGVPSSQIRHLRNSEATRAAIIEEGDPILIYYARDMEVRQIHIGGTGKIELLIPYDHSFSLEDDNPKHGIPDRTLCFRTLQTLARRVVNW